MTQDAWFDQIEVVSPTVSILPISSYTQELQNRSRPFGFLATGPESLRGQKIAIQVLVSSSGEKC